MINSRHILKGSEVIELVKEGVDLVQVYNGLILKGPYFARELQLDTQNELKEMGINDIAKLYP